MSTSAYSRKKQPEQVRRALLDAAVALAEEQGLVGVTVQAVADRAGVTKGGLFHHFPNKQALVEAAFDDIIARMDSTIDRLIERDGETEGCFTRAYVTTTFDDCGPGSSVSANALSISMITDPALRVRWGNWMAGRLRRHQATDDRPHLAVVRLAADGYWFAHILQVQDESQADLDALRARLIAMSTGPAQ